MIVGALRVELVVYESRSLKEKRAVIQSIKQRVRDRFTACVTEVDHLDSWQRCALGFALVANEESPIHAQFDRIIDLIRGNPRVSLLSYDRTFF